MNKIPNQVSEKILADVHRKLNPSLSALIAKVFCIHLVTAIVTLSVCPQFGIKLFKLPVNLMHSFMVFGLPICNFLCGVFFTATSIMIAGFVLNRDELRVMKFQKTLLSAVLLLSSIGFFGIMNPNLFLEFSFMWLLGAILGIIFTLKISFSLRMQTQV